MSQHTDVDVVIVGYGPVGQYLSFKLGRFGWTSACIERFPHAYAFPARSTSTTRSPGCSRASASTPTPTPRSSRSTSRIAGVNADKEILLELDWRGLGPSGWLRNYFFYQPDLEREINAIVATEPRAQVLRGWEAVEVVQDDGGATVLARPFEAGPDAETRTFRCRYVVGADGANSFVRSRMDVTTTDLGFEFDWLIVDMLLHEPLDRRCSAPGSGAGPSGRPRSSPAEPRTGSGGSSCGFPGETIDELNTAETAWRLVGEFGLTPENAVLERHVVYTFRARWCDRWRDGRLLLAGDAAHLMPPFAGQGMCAGLRDAENLAWKLDAVLAGQGPRFPARHLRPGAHRARPALHRAVRGPRPGHLRDRPGGGRRSRRPAEGRPRTPRARSPASAASAPRARPHRQPSAGRLPVLPGAGDRRRGQRPVRRRPRPRLDRAGPARRLRRAPGRRPGRGRRATACASSRSARVRRCPTTRAPTRPGSTSWAPTRSSSARTSTCTTPAPPRAWTPCCAACARPCCADVVVG